MFQMNPLCCISPVSLERDRGSHSVNGSKSSKLAALVEVNGSNSSPGLNRSPSVNADHPLSNSFSRGDKISLDDQNGGRSPFVRQKPSEGSSNVLDVSSKETNNVSTSVAGIVYKWVNYGKGWKSRWFVLQHGVLSYYKIHGPDKISVSQETEKGIRVIGEESLKLMRKPKHARARSKQRKAFGEVHLKAEKVELETTVVDESQHHSKECDASGGSGNGRYSEGSATESEEENESQDGVDGETDEDDDTFFDTKEFLVTYPLLLSLKRSKHGSLYFGKEKHSI